MIKAKFKPTYNFQSVEFEVEDISNKEQYEQALELYNKLLIDLMIMAPEQTKGTPVHQTVQSVAPKKPSPSERPTEQQLFLMDRFSIPYDEYTTRAEATKLINDSYKKSKE